MIGAAVDRAVSAKRRRRSAGYARGSRLPRPQSPRSLRLPAAGRISASVAPPCLGRPTGAQAPFPEPFELLPGGPKIYWKTPQNQIGRRIEELIRCVLWLSRVAGLSAAQRREALGALTEADADRTGAAAESVPAGASPAKGAKRSRREDTLGATSHERVEGQGCPHCAGREIVGWGRSHGLLRLRCKSCGCTFNALTKTPLAHLRKKERWLDHARAMIEGKSLAKTAELCGVHSDDGLPLAASVSPRARTLRRIVEADERPSSSNRSRTAGPTCRARRANGAERQGIRGSIRTTSPSSSPATGRARPSMRSCFRSTALQWEARSPASSRRPIISSATAGRRSPLSPAKPGFRSTPCRRRANQPPRRLTPHQQRQRLPLPSYLGWRRALEASGDQLAPQSGSGAPSETAHTNSERYKSQNVRELYDQQDRRLHEGACRGE